MGNGLGLVGAYGAQGGRDALEELVAQRMKETLLKQQEQQQQFENERQLASEGLNERKFGESTRQFDAGLGLDRDKFGLDKDKLGFEQTQWGDMAPQRDANVAHTGAQTGEVLRQPVKEAQDRTHATSMEGLRQTGQLRAIGASGAESRRTLSQQQDFERTMAGPGGGAPKLGAAAQQDLADMATLEQMAAEAVALGDRIKWAGVGGMGAGTRGQFLQKNFGIGTPDEQQLRSLLGNITGTLAKLRGGTSFTANEQALLEQYAPTSNDDGIAMIKPKLSGLAKFIQDKRANTLAVSGGNFGALGGNNAQINLGTMGHIDNDPMGLRGGK